MLDSKDTLVAPLVYAEPLRSVLVVKLDHIGDFFIALPAMRRLRIAFPESRVTLACGPWNRTLALSLGLFDEVIPFSFFPEQTRDLNRRRDNSHLLADTHRRFAAAVGGPYDLALDLRYDNDTRRLLTMVEARYRIGVGDTDEFPFLDVALPSDRPRSRPEQADREVRRFEVSFSPGGGRRRLAPARRDLAVRFDLDAPGIPLEVEQTSDVRALGIALRKGKLTRACPLASGLYGPDHPVWSEFSSFAADMDDDVDLERTFSFCKGTLGPVELEFGFSHPEPFGVWTDGETAQFRVPVAVGLNADLRLCLQFEGYCTPGHPAQRFDVRCNDVKTARATVEVGDGARTLILPIDRAVMAAGRVVATSEPFTVELGEAQVRVRLEPLGNPDLSGRSSVRIDVVNAVERVFGTRTISGVALNLIVANEICFKQDDPGSPLRVKVSLTGQPFDAGLSLLGAQVSVSTRKTAPSMHSIDWAGLLVDTVVRRFAPAPDLLRLAPVPLPDELVRALDDDRRAGRKTIVIATGANKDVTKWLLSYFSVLVGMLVETLPCTVYLVGAGRESPEAESIVRDHDGSERIVNLCGVTSLAQTGMLVGRADLFVGNSTGPTHAAAMSGTPTLALLSATNHPHQWAPTGIKASFLSLEVPCRQCHILFMSQCDHGYRCMVELTPEIVFTRVREILAVPSAEPDRQTALRVAEV